MANSGNTIQAGKESRATNREIATLAVRLGFFALALVPLGAFLMPWVTLDGTQETHTGIETVALLASPISRYLFEVSFVQAATLTVGTGLIAFMAMGTAFYYHRRKSIYWTPLVMLGLAIAVVFGTGAIVNATHSGLSIVIATGVLLAIHQTLIRAQVAIQHKGKFPRVHRALTILTGTGHYRWRNA